MCEESTTVSPPSLTASMSTERNSRRASGSSDSDGLVEQQQLRPLGQRERQRHLRLLAAGQLPDPLAGRQPEPVEAVAREPVVPARVQLAAEPEHLGDREAAVQRMLLGHEADAREQLARITLRRQAEHADGSGAGPAEADRDLQQRRLAGAVGPDERGDGARGDLERAVAQGPACAVALAEPVEPECAHATLRAAARTRHVVEQRGHAVGIEAGGPGASHPALEPRAKRLHLVRGQRGRLLAHERADAAATLADAFEVELAVSPEHRVGVDGQARHHLLDGGQLVARPQDAEPHGLAHLLHELEICRHAGAGFEVEFDHELFI